MTGHVISQILAPIILALNVPAVMPAVIAAEMAASIRIAMVLAADLIILVAPTDALIIVVDFFIKPRYYRGCILKIFNTIAAIFLVWAVNVQASTITLKDGKNITGDIVEQTAANTVIKIYFIRLNVLRR